MCRIRDPHAARLFCSCAFTTPELSEAVVAIMNWENWKEFRARQKSVELKAGAVAHMPVTIRYIDEKPTELEEGKGSVFLLHGIPTYSFLFKDIIPKLVDDGFRVIAPDFLGYGFSDRRDCFDRSVQDQTRVILELIKLLGIENKVHIVGHDIGGAVALILGIEHGAVVRSLTISNAVCYDRFDDDMLDFGHGMRWKPKSVKNVVSALEESLRMGLHRKSQLTESFRDGMLAPWKSEEGKLSLIRNAAALNANQTMALVDRHASIKAPTLVLWGAKDPWQKVEDGKRLANEIPNASLKIIEDASHWIPQEAPEDFYKALAHHLRSLT